MLEPWVDVVGTGPVHCELCGARLHASERKDKNMKKRWVAAIAAAAAAAVTTLTESVILGETIAHLIANLVG